jgi:hypothetical protein
MAQSVMHGEVITNSNIPQDEPVFILRPSDPAAIKMLDIYRITLEAMGLEGSEFHDNVIKEIEVMEGYADSKMTEEAHEH